MEQEFIEAHGGEALLTVSAWQSFGAGTFTTPQQLGGIVVPLVAVTLTLAQGGQARLDAMALGGRLVFGNRGEGKGGFALLMRRLQELSAAQIDGIDPLEALRAVIRGEATVQWLSLDEANGDARVLVRRDGAPEICLRVDTTTHLIRQAVTQTARGELTVQLSDYRLVDGIPYFHALTLKEEGAPVFALRFHETHLNPRLAEAHFERP